MNNKRLIIILSIFTVIFTLMGGTLAYYNWQSADNKKTNVSFTVNRNYSCAADAGGHITSSDVSLVPAKCNDPVYAIKRTITTSVTTSSNKVVSMDLWLNINEIDSNLANSPNFKWVFTKNGNTCSGAISHGTFQNIQNNRIDLLDGAEYATLDDTYYLYIWLDEAETNNNTQNQSFDFSIGGYCEDSGKEKALLVSLASANSYYKEDDYRGAITDIYFVYDSELPSGIATNNVKTYDLGANASSPITGYLIENTDQGADPGTYKLYVSSEYKIYAQSLAYAFYFMTALKTVSFANLDTSQTGSMSQMFRNCSSLTSIEYINKFNTSNVSDMSCMFYLASALTSLDVSNFDTSKVINMAHMFRANYNLTSLNITSFNTSIVQEMQYMFWGDHLLTTLDISSFNTSNTRLMTSMFYNMSSLQTIFVSNTWSTGSVTSSDSMFGGCSNLPNFDSSVTDATNAHYGVGGYLTLKH